MHVVSQNQIKAMFHRIWGGCEYAEIKLVFGLRGVSCNSKIIFAAVYSVWIPFFGEHSQHIKMFSYRAHTYTHHTEEGINVHASVILIKMSRIMVSVSGIV